MTIGSWKSRNSPAASRTNFASISTARASIPPRCGCPGIPSPNWSLQVSHGWIKSPEGLDPDVDERRFTASATYFQQFDFGSLAATAAFGNKHLSDGTDTNALLLEGEFKPDEDWTLFARGESIESKELLRAAKFAAPASSAWAPSAISGWPSIGRSAWVGFMPLISRHPRPPPLMAALPMAPWPLSGWWRNKFRRFCRLAPPPKRAS